MHQGGNPEEETDELEKLEGVVEVVDTTYYVRANKNAKKYVFDNERKHNPFRGLGSMSTTSFVLKDDANASWKPCPPKNNVVPNGKTLSRILDSTGKAIWDNSCNEDYTGGIFRLGTRVQFVAAPIAKLLTLPGTEHVAVFVKDSCKVRVDELVVPDEFDGIAANVQQSSPF